MKKETGVFKPLSFFVCGMRKNLIFFTKIKKRVPLERRMNLKLVMRAARVNSNKSLSDMSAAMGVSKATISRWERGQIPIPEEAFDVYCNICNVNKDDVVANVKPKEKEIV